MEMITPEQAAEWADEVMVRVRELSQVFEDANIANDDVTGMALSIMGLGLCREFTTAPDAAIFQLIKDGLDHLAQHNTKWREHKPQ